MKKVVFICFLMVVTIGFSQNLLTNGDFETGASAPWGGNSVNGPNLNIIDDGSGSNFVNESVINTAGEVWQVGIDQAVALTQGTTYELSFVASSDIDRTIIAGIGKAGGDFNANTVATDITTTPTTYTFSIEANFDTVTDGSRVIFDLGATVSTVILDDISLVEVGSDTCSNGVMDGDETGVDCGGSCPEACPTLPPPAPVPTVPDGETYSIYNDTNSYTAFFPFVYNFGTLGGEPNLDTNGGTNLALQFDFTVAGYGVGEGGPDDVSAYDFVSFDYWAEAGSTGFRLVMISNDQAVEEFNYEIGIDEPIITEEWTKVSIPMSFFTNLGFSETNFFQWKMDPFMQNPTQGSIVYVDNILLTQNDLLSVDNFESAQFTAYPNPTNDVWNISSTNTINNISVFNVLGKEVLTLTPNANDVTIDGSSLKTGVYFATIKGVNGSKTVKLIKE